MSDFLSGNWIWVALVIGGATLLDIWLTFKRSSFTQLKARFFVAYFCNLITRFVALAVMLILAKPLVPLTSNISIGWALVGLFIAIIAIAIGVNIVVNIVVGKIQWLAKLRDDLLPTPKNKTSTQIAFSPKEI
jgi:hypothetical protein